MPKTIGRVNKKRTRANPQKALARLRKLREMSDRFGGPTKGMTEEQVIASIKKVREELWDQHL